MELKQKMFKNGLLGAKLNELTSEEINFYLKQDYTEIFNKQELNKIISKLKPLEIYSPQAIDTANLTLENIKQSDYYIRMKPEKYSEFIQSKLFNFKMPEFLLIIDFLIRKVNISVSSDIIYKEFNIRKKVMSYIIKKMRMYDAVEVEGTLNKITSIKLKKNREGKYFFETEQENIKKPQKSSQHSNLLQINDETPIIKNIYDLILNSERGVNTKDLSEITGRPMKAMGRIAKKLLTKTDTIKQTSISKEGRFTYIFSRNDAVVSNIKSVDYLKAFEVIEREIFLKGAIVLSLELKRTIADKFNVTNLPDTRRLLRIVAAETDFKIFRTKRKQYIISKSNYNENDEIIKKLKFFGCDNLFRREYKIKTGTKKKDNESKIYKSIVYNNKLIYKSNMFLSNERLIIQTFIDCFKNIAQNENKLKTKDFVDNLTVLQFFQLFRIGRAELYNKLIRAIKDNQLKIKELENLKIESKYVKIFLSCTVLTLRDPTLFILNKYEVFKADKENIELKNPEIDLTKVKNNLPIPLTTEKERIKLANKIDALPKEGFYYNLKHLIGKKYKKEEKKFFLRLFKAYAPKKVTDVEISIPTFLIDLYFEIKALIYKKQTFESVTREGNEIERVLQYLLQNNQIVQKNNKYLLNIDETFTNFSDKVEEIGIFNIPVAFSEETYISFCTKAIYYYLMRNGSTEVKLLCKKLKFLDVLDIKKIVRENKEMFITVEFSNELLIGIDF